MKRVETNETYMCDICKKELTSLEYNNCAKMTITLDIPSKVGMSSEYTGIDEIDVCEECITSFGFIYDDLYVGSHIRIKNKLYSTYSDIINKAKLKLKFNIKK